MALVILPPGSTSTDLQAAIDSAAFGDVLQLSSDMPFSETVTVRQMLEITIRSAADSNWVMYQFNPDVRHFEIDGSLILENIIVDGRNSSGGIQLNKGAFMLQHGAVVQNCSAENGGGVELIAGTFSIYAGDASTGLPLKGGEVRNNTAENGGGVYMHAGYFNMSASTGLIGGNEAENGGGIYVNGGTYRLTGGEISNNHAANGGGLYLNSGSLSMNRGIFSNNEATNHGGGIYVSSGAGLEITGTATSIVSNHALTGNGGGIYTEDTAYSNLTISRIIFGCNKAAAAYAPPEGAGTLYPNLQFAEITITEHPLNNYDISYMEGEPIAATYNVTYNANGGSGSHTGPNIDPCETDIILSLEDTGISREGYTFTGWNTRADGGGRSYSPGDEISLTDNITLYARWEINRHTVTYNANGGSGSYADTDIPFGTDYTVLSSDRTGISRTDYGFAGWNTQADGNGTSYAPEDIIVIRQDVTLYAQWKATLYTVTYDANGGSGSYIDTDIIYGTKYTVLSLRETRIRHGDYELTGWNTEADGSGIFYDPGDTIIIQRNVTLYARWKADAGTVTYDANGGSGSYVDADILHGTRYTVLSLRETGIRHGDYECTGWNTKADGSGVLYAFGDTIIMQHDVTLYAQWKVNIGTVTYHANGGSGGYVDTDILYGKKYTVLSLRETGIRHGDYECTGWNTEADGSGIAYVPGDRILLTGNLILYAQWETGDTPYDKDFCSKFCREFSREFSKVCCNRCHRECCEVCCNICDKICRRQTDRRCGDRDFF